MAVRLNITMDEAVYERLKKEVRPKKMSAFITDAVRAKLRPDRQTLDGAYKAASKERWRRRLAADWGGTDTEDGRNEARARRGEIYWVALDPTLGAEIKKTRPAVVVSNDSCNTHGHRASEH